MVKVLGAIALIGEGETDWKVLAIAVEDALAAGIDDTVDWFKIYKVPDGKPKNKFAFDGQAKDADFAADVVESLHDDG